MAERRVLCALCFSRPRIRHARYCRECRPIVQASHRDIPKNRKPISMGPPDDAKPDWNFEVSFINDQGFRVTKKYEFESKANGVFRTMKGRDAAGLRVVQLKPYRLIDSYDGSTKIAV